MANVSKIIGEDVYVGECKILGTGQDISTNLDDILDDSLSDDDEWNQVPIMNNFSNSRNMLNILDDSRSNDDEWTRVPIMNNFSNSHNMLNIEEQNISIVENISSILGGETSFSQLNETGFNGGKNNITQSGSFDLRFKIVRGSYFRG